jgi:chromosome segregation ATPase
MTDEFRLFTDFAVKSLQTKEHGVLIPSVEAKFQAIVSQSRHMSAEQSAADAELMRQTELVLLFSETFAEKTRLLESKRLFIDYLSKIRHRNKQLLESIFDRLNHVEDEYAIIENSIAKLQKAHSQNAEEIESVERRIEHLERVRLALQKEVTVSDDDLQVSRNVAAKKQEELQTLRARAEEMRQEIEEKHMEFEGAQNKLFLEGFALFEQREKLAYLEENISRGMTEVLNVQRARERYRFDITAKISALEDVLKRKDAEEEQLAKVQRALRVIEGEIEREGIVAITAQNILT